MESWKNRFLSKNILVYKPFSSIDVSKYIEYIIVTMLLNVSSKWQLVAKYYVLYVLRISQLSTYLVVARAISCTAIWFFKGRVIYRVVIRRWVARNFTVWRTHTRTSIIVSHALSHRTSIFDDRTRTRTRTFSKKIGNGASRKMLLRFIDLYYNP